ncbi:MAG TPA: YIP1 family protein [Steroidobacteraceae bacterium]|nr:YIP1 family protein [Steroidobacteraceae bacterium]
MLPTDTIRPLHDVWLRPRRVFRALADKPVGPWDFALGALQGMVGSLVMSHLVGAGAHASALEIFVQAILFGSISGLISLFLFAEIYLRLGASAGGASTRARVIHVLAYGGVPVAASLGLWVLTALLAGPVLFMKSTPADAEGFVVLLLDAHFVAFWLLGLWSVVLQVMGLSEIQAFRTRKAFLVWVLGQALALLGSLMLLKLLSLWVPIEPPT